MILLSGNPPGEVPSDCFPRIDDVGITKTPKAGFFCARVSDINGEIDPLTTDQDATPTESPTITIQRI